MTLSTIGQVTLINVFSLVRLNTIMKTCPKCNTVHNNPGKFCSRKCANSRVRSEDLKKRVSEKLKGRTGPPSPTKGKQLVERITKSCPSCNTVFSTTLARNRLYCSEDCRRKHAGGYRDGSGRAKTGYYKGIYCGSTYELVWVIYNIDHGIGFSRFPGCITDKVLKYYPDFILADNKTIIEIKGFENKTLVDKKTQLAESFGYIVKVCRKFDIQYAFDYVTEKYNTSKYYTLYDDYKPSYQYSCSQCADIFSRNKKLKTEIGFCSRKCAGKGHLGRK